jgi:hypothetical protein
MIDPMNLRQLVVPAVALGAIAAAGRPAALPAQSPPQSETLRVIGIVEVPRVFPAVSADRKRVPPDSPLPILLRDRPSMDSPVVATISSPEALDAREFGYEESGAMVYGRDRGWSRVRTPGGVTGWLAPDDAGSFHSLEALLDDGLTYLTEAWDRRLGAAPGAENRARVPTDPRRRFVGYLEPQLRPVRVVLEAAQDPETVRQKYRASGMSSRPGPNGTRILHVDTGIFLPLFERPDRDARVTAQVETNRCSASVQTLGGIPEQVPVFETRPGWYQVALRTDDYYWWTAKKVWLEEAPVWRFRSVTEEAEQERLAERAWGPEQWTVRVVGLRRIADRLWVDVEVLSHSICGSTEEPTVRARGWMSAHAPSGAPAIWFHSRGC